MVGGSDVDRELREDVTILEDPRLAPDKFDVVPLQVTLKLLSGKFPRTLRPRCETSVGLPPTVARSSVAPIPGEAIPDEAIIPGEAPPFPGEAAPSLGEVTAGGLFPEMPFPEKLIKSGDAILDES